MIVIIKFANGIPKIAQLITALDSPVILTLQHQHRSTAL